MTTHARWSRTLSLALVLLAAALASPRTACADEPVPYRFGLVGVIGGGMAGVVHPGPLPGFIGFTDLGAEILGERRPWGGFLRVDFLSSGDSGRWTSFAFGAGTEYRLGVDVGRGALFLRGGLSYERWTGRSGGCPINFLVPSSCNNLNLAASTYDVTTDTVGLLGGVRYEVPLSAFYLALSASFAPAVAVDQSYPAAVFQLRFALEAGFRDARTADQGTTVRKFDGTRVKTETVTPFGQ